ncbi:phosphate transporter 1 [Prunus dulcis]|uniref:Phosphate transporter 1 n=1 Tax=Prunus dulcis TaxID=3755 RepID=A0A4Y1S0D8_PRUDU|nr:phosphate transporter 1 [Prunus dulcis]
MPPLLTISSAAPHTLFCSLQRQQNPKVGIKTSHSSFLHTQNEAEFIVFVLFFDFSCSRGVSVFFSDNKSFEYNLLKSKSQSENQKIDKR